MSTALAGTGASTPPAARATGQPQVYALPTGDRVQVSGSGDARRAHFLPAPGHPAAAVTSLVDGRLTVVPVSAFGHISSLADFTVGSSDGGTVTPQFAMALLHIKALDHGGSPAAVAEVIVINTDDLTRAHWDGLMSGGDSRIQVPAGHYSVAVAIFNTDAKGNSTETDLLSVTDVTVPAAGTTVTLDGRSAHPVSFATPQPSVNADLVVGWIRGAGTHRAVLDVGALPGTKLYVGAAAPAQYGFLQYSVVARQVSPASAASPYTYLLSIPRVDRIPANQAYTVAASSLATIDSTNVTDQPGQDFVLWHSWRLASDGPNEAAMPDLSAVQEHAPSVDRQYVSASANLIYDGLMLPVPNAFLDGELERFVRAKPGEHRYLTWRGGLIVPAPSTVDGPCFLCREGNNLHGVGVMDTDASGDIGQWSDGPTTITQDGKTIYTGTTMGVTFDQPLPAAKHRYVYAIDATHGTEQSALSTHSQISWGFDSQKVTGSAPVPILYANAWFDADGHESVAPGPATFEMELRHQPSAADPAVTAASVDVSYDDGTTWHPLSVTLPDAHHVRGTWTVPAGTRPGYLAVHFHAVDAAGSTVDETVTHAALVNAPKGIALPPGGASSGGTPAGATAVCPSARAGYARCLALVAGKPRALPDGLARADLLSAYKLPNSGGAGRTVAIVDAHDDPTAEADLAAYRKTYGLPPCTTQNGCFKKVNQNGKTAPLPKFDPADDWSVEVSLDLDMVSAVCPECHILLVESDDASTVSLGTAEKAATGSGAVAVSNSWGGDETSDAQPFTANFSHAGVAVTASSGDSGFLEASWPASLAGVIAVGGTSLAKSTSARGWTETAWRGSGSGCSGYVAKPAWQHDAHCTMRTASDISAVADPATGVAVYVQGGWIVAGGTSASSPIIASMIALAGNASALTSAKYIYAHASNLYDVTSGSNANWNCGGDYLCTAGKGYDAPTGLGTPNGLGAL
ncbi:MAG: hypothetical protein AUI14_26290 [Actinobacteria bacterium 13_2_20CM_2_71_6]|nr:MAG: hypothetical protein AUI14_26290 [Actinobacteria bacterium 13_2_20CM_2_71_6]